METSKDITAEVREIDVVFIPSPQLATSSLETLGLLGKMATSYAIFEPFRNPVTTSNIRSCLSKLFDIYAELERESNRNNTSIKEVELPHLWILTPTASVALLASFNATIDEPNWSRGIYFLPPALKTAIIVIHQLPRTPQTLWLRILGRGKVQQRAIEELKALPEESLHRTEIIQLVYDLIAVLSARQRQEQDIDKDDRELIMKLSEMYQQELERATKEGVQQGLEQGVERERRAMIESIMQVRFGEVDPQLATIIDSLIAMTREEFTPLLLQLSREELLARFGQLN